MRKEKVPVGFELPRTLTFPDAGNPLRKTIILGVKEFLFSRVCFEFPPATGVPEIHQRLIETVEAIVNFQSIILHGIHHVMNCLSLPVAVNVELRVGPQLRGGLDAAVVAPSQFPIVRIPNESEAKAVDWFDLGDLVGVGFLDGPNLLCVSHVVSCVRRAELVSFRKIPGTLTLQLGGMDPA